jgi:hypothetical protein
VTLDVEGVMRRMIFRLALSFVLAILLFWGTATLSGNRGTNVEKSDPLYNDWAPAKREQLLW